MIFPIAAHGRREKRKSQDSSSRSSTETKSFLLFSLSLSLSLSSLRPRNNLFVLLSTAEFIAASLPETRPQENPLRVRSLIFSRSTRFFARSYLRSRSSRGRESEYRTRKRERIESRMKRTVASSSVDEEMVDDDDYEDDDGDDDDGPLLLARSELFAVSLGTSPSQGGQ